MRVAGRVVIFLVLEAFVVLMCITPYLFSRTGMVKRRHVVPLTWTVGPVVFALGTVIALAVATAE